MIRNDKWITQQAAKGMITPFVPQLVRKAIARPAGLVSDSPAQYKAISYGLSSYGYDIRLSPNDFRIFRHVPGTVIDPKNFSDNNLEPAQLTKGERGDYFILPGHSYGLGVAVERLAMPGNVTGVCLGKSTYARVGIIVNMTPAEAGWCGHLTLEFSNSSSADCRLYVNEGVAQMLFFEGESCETTYEDRNGKYQGQPERVVIAKV